MTSLDDRLKRSIKNYLKETEGSVNGLANKAALSESTIRAILTMDDRSATLGTVEKLAEGMGNTPAELLGLEEESIDGGLLADLLLALLHPQYERDPEYAHELVQAVLRTYRAARANGVSSQDKKGIRLLTAPEADRLAHEFRRPKGK